MALTERVTNNYDKWTQSGDLTWELRDDDSKARLTSDALGNASHSAIEKSFELTGEAAVKTATLTVARTKYKAARGGRAVAAIKLKDADDVWHSLPISFSAGSGLLTFLDELDIKSYLTKEGTYILRFSATVKATDVGYWIPSYYQFNDVSLMAEKYVDWEKTFLESAPATESYVSGMTFLEPAPATEYFMLGRTVPLASVDEKLLVAKTDKKVYEFVDGAPEGIFDIHDEDFGMPGVDKTFDKAQFSSPAEAPHTVEVLISTDSGLTWTSYGLYTVSKGVAGRVSVWITAEKFCVRFKGAGLNLDAYSLYGVPRGAEVPEVT